MKTVMTLDLPQVKYNVMYMPENGRCNPFVIYRMENGSEWEEVIEYADLTSCFHCIKEEVIERYGNIEKITQNTDIEVFLSTYDGFYIVKEGEYIETYEGAGLLPEYIKEWLKNNEPKEIHDFHEGAIAYV